MVVVQLSHGIIQRLVNLCKNWKGFVTRWRRFECKLDGAEYNFISQIVQDQKYFSMSDNLEF